MTPDSYRQASMSAPQVKLLKSSEWLSDVCINYGLGKYMVVQCFPSMDVNSP